ncbi:hypothetical protein SAMN05421810_101885 [Amycolatopsis arida]|uniref:DUF6879 domain-containing protein n=1 Tax=Amycolatopsis arida TaxID=587909 RepID=A0A1I5MDQ6_9PSEU|nr:DUF6879 family protein [Amycolatopsis arida]TDX94059.1 hypothetical protein CLV69_104517 [Amycolatopsis arida]SFP07660.1 hypothetical protein SAMN05421810_101885 [Amycolatopsis arida]
MQLTPRADFEALFDTFTESAWRLECQGVYREPEEAEPLRRFLAGEPDDLAWYADWPEWVRGARASGRTIGRVRVLTEPLTDYLRFELGRLTPPAVDAGEDIRLLAPDEFDALGLPREDFWIFDDAQVAVLHFGDHGVSGVELITEPGRVAEFLERKRRASAGAVPYHQWAGRA